MTLSKLAIILGLGFGALHLYGLLNPSNYSRMLRGFPRSIPLGCLLMAAGLAWFLWNLKNEAISDFASYKFPMYIAFTAIAVGTCLFVQDFLAARGFGVVLLLLGKLMVDTARWAESDWRLVIVVWAYIMVIAGMWITISPWRLRDFIEWNTANEKRIKLGSAVRVGFGLLLVVLGLVAFR